MLKDALNEFSDKQAVTVSAIASKTIDQGNPGDAKLTELFLHVIATEAATADGDATVQVVLETSATAADNALTGTIVTLASSAVVPVADIVAGKTLFKIRQPEGSLGHIGVKYIVATGPLTAGKFDAFLCADA
jgi:Bbp16